MGEAVALKKVGGKAQPRSGVAELSTVLGCASGGTWGTNLEPASSMLLLCLLEMSYLSPCAEMFAAAPCLSSLCHSCFCHIASQPPLPSG